MEVVSEDEDGLGLIILDEERSKFPDVVMRLRSPLKYDLASSADQDQDSDQDSPGLFSVIRLHFVIRDKQLRMGGGWAQQYILAFISKNVDNFFWHDIFQSITAQMHGIDRKYLLEKCWGDCGD